MSEQNQASSIVLPMATAGITAKRRRSATSEAAAMPIAASEDAYLVTVQLGATATAQLWRNDECVFDGAFEHGAIAIFDLSDRWSEHFRSGFDFLSFHIPFDTLARSSISLGFSGVREIACEIGVTDPVLLSLSLSLLPALENPAAANKSFLLQVQNAIVSHLLHVYAPIERAAPARGLLSPRQEELAKDFMRANFNRSISLEETAQACGLSRSHFIRAFRNTTGSTPHRWLLDYRTERVKALLASAMTIADIASACGFADQSHLNRVFQKTVGLTPTAWRRQFAPRPR
jgi:AraC family transcriptional regulator